MTSATATRSANFDIRTKRPPRRRKPNGFTPAPSAYPMDGLPPCRDADRLRLVLRMVPGPLREEAVQIAWLAHLEGEDPARTVDTWREAERRRRRRERTNYDL